MPIYVFYKKPIAQRRSKTSGGLNGVERFFFAHGSTHSRGVAILIRKGFDFKFKSSRSDEEGRYLILEASIQDANFLLVNSYAPNVYF